jgi:hypothetical protein
MLLLNIPTLYIRHHEEVSVGYPLTTNAQLFDSGVSALATQFVRAELSQKLDTALRDSQNKDNIPAFAAITS